MHAHTIGLAPLRLPAASAINLGIVLLVARMRMPTQSAGCRVHLPCGPVAPGGPSGPVSDKQGAQASSGLGSVMQVGAGFNIHALMALIHGTMQPVLATLPG